MKEIKFRVWDKTFKMMLSPELVDIDFNEGKIEVTTDTLRYEEVYTDEIKDFVLMQYTNLKDKNGKEIYEGDILKVKFDTETINLYVRYDMGEYRLIKYGEWEDGLYDCMWFHEVEVVGGVFIVQEDETDLDVLGTGSGFGLAGGGRSLFRGGFGSGSIGGRGSFGLSTAGAQADAQRQSEQQSNELFHVFFPPVIFCFFTVTVLFPPASRKKAKRNCGNRSTASANERKTKQKKTLLCPSSIVRSFTVTG